MEKKEGDKSNRRSLRDPSCSKNYSEFDYDSNCEESRFEKMANYLEDSGDDRNYEPDLKRSRKDSSSDISSDENIEPILNNSYNAGQVKNKTLANPKASTSAAGQSSSKTLTKSKAFAAGPGSSKNFTKNKTSTADQGSSNSFTKSATKQTKISFTKSSDTSSSADQISSNLFTNSAKKQTKISFTKSSDISAKDDSKKGTLVANPFYGKKQPIVNFEIFENNDSSAN